MQELLVKLNYKGQDRIAIINSEEGFLEMISAALKNVTIDTRIDPRYPYSFIILFVQKITEVEYHAPMAVHNLMADGILWFFYPKKTSGKYKSDVDRDHGWEALTNAGLRGVRMISVDEDWSGLRFRNIRYIKSTHDRSSR
jgi:hypothetical protein